MLFTRKEYTKIIELQCRKAISDNQRVITVYNSKTEPIRVFLVFDITKENIKKIQELDISVVKFWKIDNRQYTFDELLDYLANT